MSDRSTWDWLDPLGIRGTRWDPTVIMRDLAKGTMESLSMVDLFSGVLKRLEGRRIEIEGSRNMTLVVGEITDAVPANEVVMGARGTAVPIWREVKLGVHSIDVGGLGAEHADVTAVDIRFEDRGSQRISVASLSARVLLTEVQFADLVADFDLPAEVEVSGTKMVVRPRWGAKADRDRRDTVGEERITAPPARVDPSASVDPSSAHTATDDLGFPARQRARRGVGDRGRDDRRRQRRGHHRHGVTRNAVRPAPDDQ